MYPIGVFITIALCLSFILVKGFIIQFRKTLIDLPNERSSHTVPTPRGGGLGFILSFYIVAGIASGLTSSYSPQFIWLSLIPLILVGFLDDWKDLPASTRYFVQLLVSTVVVVQLGAFPIFPGQSTAPTLEVGAIVFSIIGMTALINFYNFMDGLDGLVAGTVLIQLSFLAIWSQNFSLWILIAALVGFLLWNWHPAKIFMGDSGSTFLGATIAIAILSKNTTSADAWAALSITFPITIDTIYTLIRRLIRKENILQAHRSHLFQRLHQAGLSHTKVSILYVTASLLLCLTLLKFGSAAFFINIMGAALTLTVTECYLQFKNSAPTTAASRTDS